MRKTTTVRFAATLALGAAMSGCQGWNESGADEPTPPAPLAAGTVPCFLIETPAIPGRATAPLGPPPTYDPSNAVTWVYGSSIADADRAYLEGLITELEPVLRQIVGPPSSSPTVTIETGATGVAAATYTPSTNRMTLGRLPAHSGLMDGRIDAATFDEVFAHEVVHVYQDAALDAGFTPWIAEGLAVAATAILRERLPRAAPAGSIWSATALSLAYGPLAQLDGATLAGESSLRGPLFVHRYIAAGGVFFTLAASQPGGLSERWDAYDYLARLLEAHYGRGLGLDAESVLDTVGTTASAPIDGVDAAAWVRAQPIADLRAEPGVRVFATLVQPAVFTNPLSASTLLFQPLQRSTPGGAVTPIESGAMRLTYRDATGAVVHVEEITLAHRPLGFQYVFLPPAVRAPGASVVELDATGIGGPVDRLVLQRVAGPSTSGSSADDGHVVTLLRVDGSIVDAPLASAGNVLERHPGVTVAAPDADGNTTLSVDGAEVSVTTAGPRRRLVIASLAAAAPPPSDAGADADAGAADAGSTADPTDAGPAARPDSSVRADASGASDAGVGHPPLRSTSSCAVAAPGLGTGSEDGTSWIWLLAGLSVLALRRARWGACALAMLTACADPGGDAVEPGTAREALVSVAGPAETLVADDGDAGDGFGRAAAIDGDTIVIGAPADDSPAGLDTGSAYVIGWDGTAWVPLAHLVAPTPAASDRFGSAVAISGDTVLVGAPGEDGATGADTGAAYVFARDPTGWAVEARLEGTATSAGASFGHSVALDGDTAIVGAPRNDAGGPDAGSAHVFVRGPGGWMQEAELGPALPWARSDFGAAVALDGDLAVVGARKRGRTGSLVTSFGAAYVFARAAGAWSQAAELTASDGVGGDFFGHSVAVLGDTILIGAHRRDTASAAEAGGAYVFRRVGPTWSQEAILTASDGAATDLFGSGVALLPETALVGSPQSDSIAGYTTGSVYAYGRRGTDWYEEARLQAPTAAMGDQLGTNVAASSERVVSGADAADVGGIVDAGRAHVFTLRWTGDGPLGSGCSLGTECASGHCVDGVCCDSSCGGGAVDDCMACSVTAGSATEGTCGPLSAAVAPTVVCRHPAGPCDGAETCVAADLACPADDVAPAGTVCRAAISACDEAETCDGLTDVCPPDAWAPAGGVCRPEAGPCDVAETCTGASGACPADGFVGPGVVCRSASDVCDAEETCTGTAATCPLDRVADGTTICRPAVGECDATETCSGLGPRCPEDRDMVDGTLCADGLTCTHAACAAGACVPFAMLDCDDGDPCTADMCAEPTGCAHVPIDGCPGPGPTPRDGGTDRDASVRDPARPDAAQPDAATGTVDAAAPALDAGPDRPAAAPTRSGCSAASGPVGSPPLVLGAFVLVLGLARRAWRS